MAAVGPARRISRLALDRPALPPEPWLVTAVWRYAHSVMRKWVWWHQGSGPDEYRIRELLRGIWDLHSMFGADEPWLWRGQANGTHRLEPGLHTRVAQAATLDDSGIETLTNKLIKAARDARLDRHEGTALPDLALLAMLQHHGAATPLLDVSLDPIVALYMAVVSPNPADAKKDGALFAIKRPQESLAAFDSRPFVSVYSALSADSVVMYSAPDVSERLRIQRGHFLLGRVSTGDKRVTLPLTVPSGPSVDTWIWKRMAKRGQKGPVTPATTDIAVFRIASKFKQTIQRWLEERSGMTPDFVYPTPWHQPHLGRFAASHGRRAPV